MSDTAFGFISSCSQILQFLFKLQSSKGELTALVHQLQEKDKLLVAVKEDAAATKDRCKQLAQVRTLLLQTPADQAVKHLGNCPQFLIYSPE